MTHIECPFCKAYATRVPGPTVTFDEWRKTVTVFSKGVLWGLPLTSKLRKVERLVDKVKEIAEGEEHYMGKESALDYDGTIEAICEELRDALALFVESND